LYNRYTPQPDGTYRRKYLAENQRQEQRSQNRHPAPPPPQPPPNQECKTAKPVFHFPATDFLRQLLPKNLDTGDLMIILLLLLMAGDSEENKTNALLTLGLYLLMS
jgi:hypothetical protein